jgi:hypothetical protein
MLEQEIEGWPHNASPRNRPAHNRFLKPKDRAIVIIVFMTLAAVILAIYVMVHDWTH